MHKPTFPIALTIAGSDSGGGAGIQADLKTFAALGVHGTTAITGLTAQNPVGVSGIQPTTPTLLRQQLESVFAELPPSAIKTGMLLNAALVRVVVHFFKKRKHPPLIVDPVLVSTSGVRLLAPAGRKLLEQELLPLAALVTPNLDEAGLLLGRNLKTIVDVRGAARDIQARYGCAALVKGGHLRGMREAVDIFNDGRIELLLAAPFIPRVKTHGTGCTYSAAITGYLALGCDLPYAVQLAKNHITQAIAQSRDTWCVRVKPEITADHITQAIAQSRDTARHSVLNNFWEA